MTDRRKSGQIDLETELKCSICTEILFKPLTLLDCLHTFCGACLQEWFAFQASSAKSLHPYTCPSCRASVRATKPNATVTTLLDMYLQANPTKARTAEDIMEQSEKFKPGDNVMPKLRLRRAPGDDEEQRVMDDTVALSLREAGITRDALLEPASGRRRRDGSRGSRSRSGNSSDQGNTRSRTGPSQPTSRRGAPRGSRNASRDISPRQPESNVEHQNSLRFLMSATEMDPQEMQEEILRQIVEEGLLDGIDLENMDLSQEEALSEQIARAWREDRLGERRNRERPAPTSMSQNLDQSVENEEGQTLAGGAVLPVSNLPAAPPISNPHLISSANFGQGQPRQHRSGSHGSILPATRIDSAVGAVTNERMHSEVYRQSRATSSGAERTRRISQGRSATDPDLVRVARNSYMTSSGSAPGPPMQLRTTSVPRQRSGSHPRPPRSPRAGVTYPTDRDARPTNNSSPSLMNGSDTPVLPNPLALALTSEPGSDDRPPSSSRSSAQPGHPVFFVEPSISCARCQKSHIEYELHYSCLKCGSGMYHLCLRCYRSGKGCLNWYGFGRAAWQRYARQEPPGGYSLDHETPHALSGHRYQRPKHPLVPDPNQDRPGLLMTEEDPQMRLEVGVFCDMCDAFANACYWKCDSCNEGAWGFCNSCVNQGKHCTHPLLPLKSKNSSIANSMPGTDQPRLSKEPASTPPLTPKHASVLRGTVQLANVTFQPLTFSADCDMCHFPIAPSLSRFHCPRCEDGDYDICTNCYHNLVSSNRITGDNGHQGWRRCLQGHRMCIVGFEDRHDGQRRIVVAEMVGGWALKEDEIVLSTPTSVSPAIKASVSTSTPPNWSWKDADGTQRRATVRATQTDSNSRQFSGRFPPNGGVGLRVLANWSYFPEDGVEDELFFPKGADIRECEDINGDWFWGVYAGGKGLFPGNYGVVLGLAR